MIRAAFPVSIVTFIAKLLRAISGTPIVVRSRVDVTSSLKQGDRPLKYASTRPLVDVVTVNWNSGHQLADCVQSVMAIDPDIVSRFVVVDNASIDGSANLAEDWPKLTIDHVGENLGFGRGCNRGAQQGTAPYLLFLNPDTRLTEPAISAAVRFMEQGTSSDYAVLGIKLREESGLISKSTARFPSKRTFIGMLSGLDVLWPKSFPPLLMNRFDHERSRSVDHVQGAFYLVRREAFESVGGFDEEYFVYFEDVDLSFRISANGGKVYFLADTEAWHRGGGTSGQIKGRARFYGIDARLLYSQKHYNSSFNLMHLILTFTLEPIASVAWYLYRYHGRNLGAVAKAFGLLYANAPRILRRHPSPAAPFNRRSP